MKKKIEDLIKYFLSSFFLIVSILNFAMAETASDEYALFKKTISQVFFCGNNGILIIPTAIPVGRGNMYLI